MLRYIGEATRSNAGEPRFSMAIGVRASLFFLRLHNGNRNLSGKIFNSHGRRLAAEIAIGYTACDWIEYN